MIRAGGAACIVVLLRQVEERPSQEAIEAAMEIMEMDVRQRPRDATQATVGVPETFRPVKTTYYLKSSQDQRHNHQ